MSREDKMKGLKEGALMPFAEAEAFKKGKLLEQIQRTKLPLNMGTDLEKYDAAQRKIQEIIDRDGGQPVLEQQTELRPPIDIENDPYAREIPMLDENIQRRALQRLRER